MQVCASQFAMDPQELIFLKDDVRILSYSTPMSVRLGDSAEFIVLTKAFYPEYQESLRKRLEQWKSIVNTNDKGSEEDGGEGSDDEGVELISIKLNQKGVIHVMRVTKDMTILQVMDQYKKEASKDGKVTLKFDGEVLDEDETLDGLDVDDGDQFDLMLS